jgi:hypothetical protein
MDPYDSNKEIEVDSGNMATLEEKVNGEAALPHKLIHLMGKEVSCIVLCSMRWIERIQL